MQIISICAMEGLQFYMDISPVTNKEFLNFVKK